MKNTGIGVPDKLMVGNSKTSVLCRKSAIPAGDTLSPKPENKQHNLSIKFDIKSVHEDEEEEDKFGFFEGFGSTFGNIDLVNDRIERGAFKKTLKSGHKIKLLWQHSSDEIIGTIVEAEETDDGLFVKGRINLGTQRGQEALALLKAGDIDTMSIGFFIKDSELEKDGLRVIKEIDLFEISLVTFAANPEAVVTDVKKREIVFQDLDLSEKDSQWDADGAVKRIQELEGFVDEEGKPTVKYKEAFVWFDPENADNFGAYKLPVADVIDGKLTAIPRGIIAAAGALQSARGGIDILEADKLKARSHLERYFVKMRKEFDDQTLVEPWNVVIGDLETLKEVEGFLRTRGLTQTEATAIVSAVKRNVSQGEPDQNGNQGEPDSDEVDLAIEIIKLTQLYKDKKNG